MARNGTILYVEDNENDLLLFQAAVKRCHPRFAVEWVNNIRAAKEYLRGQGAWSDRALSPFPALVLSDYSMPGGTGQDLLRWIRRQPGCSELAVILFTSSPKPERIERCYQCGLNAFLVKPVEIGRLVHLVQCLDKCLEAQPPSCDSLGLLPEYRGAKAASSR